MTLYNTGTFETETEVEMRELITIINKIGLGTVIFDERNTYSPDGRCFLEVSECMGDLDPALREIVKACKSAGLKMDFYITYFGDAEGGYMYRNGVYETLGREDLCLQEISDTALLAEIRRRGLMQKISNDCVRDFMKSELVQQYGFTEKQASKAAVFAFERYISTEGATQYDGIELAASEFDPEKPERSPAVYVSQSYLKDYWDDYAISIKFQDGTDAPAQKNGYTLEQCLAMQNVEFFLS